MRFFSGTAALKAFDWSAKGFNGGPCRYKNRSHQKLLAKILQERSFRASAEKFWKFLEIILQQNV